MFDIFVISPYTHPDKDVVEQRAKEAVIYLGELIREGKIAHSTIAAFHHMLDIADLPNDFFYWKMYCTKMIMSADEVHVLCLDGWEESEGAQAEIKIAKTLGKKIKYITKVGSKKC